MTTAFISYWKLKTGCKSCRAIPGRHLCTNCLRQARAKWHSYVATRVTKGLCIQCPRKPKKNEQRCRSCADTNRQNCLNYYHEVRKFQVQRLHQQGICAACHERPVRGVGTYYCAPCNQHKLDLANGRVQSVKKPYKFLEMR